ncbi:BEN domain-containing protein 6 [Bagarius yarrelli]|uniref:BEN domain-containing protein 6 n=1 Tax=Bagarius yarrelli TaxID=175774 RepID=A0A556TJ13_BAGYA|nr:BEN domain-containing protein 6 [Bagarius yarrelli]
MRRKTKAKRVLDYENEERDEKEEQKRDEFYHGLQKRRKQMDAAKERAEENSPAAAGLQKLDTRGYGFDCSPPGSFDEGHPTAEQEAEYLQSYSKMDLIAMVLCMQREMESLKEQLRCLTACGKLAKNIEALIERTQMWPNGDKMSLPVTSSPVTEPVEVDALVPALQYASGVMNGQWVKQDTLTQKSREVSHGNGLFTEFITPELLERCNTGTTAQKLTNDLLRGLYERDCLASHSISGVVYNKRGQPKPALPTEEVQAILRTVQYFFPGKTDAEIKGYIRQKLQNEAKRLRKKPSISGPEPRALSLSSQRSSSHQLDFIGQKSNV